MPIIIINMLEGRSSERKRKLLEKITEAVVESLDVEPESVRVIINEIPKENFSVAGLPIEEFRELKRGNSAEVKK
ncbi:4-oxalocrotonate tautomerase [Candidatus Thermokryptus mobilis]|uniref:Tautomerase n=1 Tax=Candidatus Thermokryptus mobilis TaxID=1643428 RepID=A0A0S4MVA7_9BACT|nr:2-hydroxymuconate tautomerase [Candidatus Thermokryptus mobilis]CUU02940.1 4-oxalocrotonate tautomerase [Candidatus Thermokryptus mobilis]